MTDVYSDIAKLKEQLRLIREANIRSSSAMMAAVGEPTSTDKIDTNVENITGEPTRKNTADSAAVVNQDDELISGYPLPFPLALKKCYDRIEELQD